MANLLQTYTKDLDGFYVRRILPHRTKRMVGPFIFIDHFGPIEFNPGEGLDFKPHPHIGLSTITYLLEGSLLHRDSLGNSLELLPGDVNWMTAGSGIVHSERETIEAKFQKHRINGMQCWIALPKEKATIPPSFTHILGAKLPHHINGNIHKRLIAGNAYGLSSPIQTYSNLFYLDVIAKAGDTVDRPNPHQECMIYLLEGRIQIDELIFKSGDVILLEKELFIKVTKTCRMLMLGGDAWPKTPYIDWNFVSFDQSKIEEAKKLWVEGKFPKIPGDSAEFAPLPEKK